MVLGAQGQQGIRGTCKRWAACTSFALLHGEASLAERMGRVLSVLTATGIVSALIFAPLAFGAVEPWAYSVLAVLSCTALAAAAAAALVAGKVRHMAAIMLLPAAAALVLVGLQYARWPVGLVRLASPRAVHIYQDAAPPGAGQALHATLSPSLYRQGTRDALIRLSSYVALFAAACTYARSRKQMARLAAVIVAVGFIVSLLGILQSLSGTHRLYWWRELTHGGAPFGPFVSRNQFAAYAGICLFVGLGLLLARLARPARGGAGSRLDPPGTVRKCAHQNLLLGFAASVTGAAVIWSLSRGGILALLLSLAGVLAALKATGLVRSRLLHVGAVAVVAMGLITYLGWEPVLRRFATLENVARDPLGDWRWMMLRDATRIGLDFPILGTGAGTFMSVYPLYRTLPTNALAGSPHNEYVHVFAETGFTGLAILAAAMVLFYRRIIAALSSSKDPFVLGLIAGGIGAPLVVSFHSLVDFPMRSPAIAATLAVAAALLYQAAGMDSAGHVRTKEPA